MKKRYVVQYSGVFCTGYLILRVFGSGKHKEFKIGLGIKEATKFRFKFMASFWCWVANRDSDINYDFMTFKVIKYEKD